MEKIKIVIAIDCGIVIGVSTDYPVEVLVIDHETDGVPDEELTHFSGDTYDYTAYAYEQEVQFCPKVVKRLFEQAEKPDD